MTTGFNSLKIEVAQSQDPINTASPTWTDVTSMVHNFTTNRGRDNFWDSHSPGSAAFSFNNDFFNTVVVIPNTPIRVSVNDSTTTRKYLFAGFLRPQAGYVVDVAYNVSGTTLQALDFIALLAEQNFTAKLASAGSRVGAFLALIVAAYTPLVPAWQTSAFDDGQTIMQDLEAGGTILDVIQNLVFSEGGAFYILGDGTVNFDDRMAIVNTSRIATSQIAFDDVGAGDSSYGVTYTLYQPPVYTTATVTRANDESLTIIEDGNPKQVQQPFTYSDVTNVLLYGTSAFPPVTNMLASSNAETQALARRIVKTTSGVVSAPQTIRLFPRRDNDQLDASVQRELRDRATFTNALTTPSSEDVWVERIQHTIDLASRDWTCDLSFTSRSQGVTFGYDPESWLVLDDPTEGALDGFWQLAW